MGPPASQQSKHNYKTNGGGAAVRPLRCPRVRAGSPRAVQPRGRRCPRVRCVPRAPHTASR